jgi:hypothetical protein
MDDFGTMRVFKGSTSFKLCPMCRSKSTDSPTTKSKKSTLLNNRNDNPGAEPKVSSTSKASDSTRSDKEEAPVQPKMGGRDNLGTPGNTRRDAGDDEEDERFLHELEEDL